MAVSFIRTSNDSIDINSKCGQKKKKYVGFLGEERRKKKEEKKTTKD